MRLMFAIEAQNLYQNMQPVVLIRIQVLNICYNHNGGNHSNKIDVILILPPK